jgi:hypothetical protein
MSRLLEKHGVVVINFGATQGLDVYRFSDQGCVKLMDGVSIPWLSFQCGNGKYWPLEWLEGKITKICGMAEDGDIICGAMWGADVLIQYRVGGQPMGRFARFYASIPQSIMAGVGVQVDESIYLRCNCANVAFYQPYAQIMAVVQDGLIALSDIINIVPMADVMTAMLCGEDIGIVRHDKTMLQSMGLLGDARNAYADIFDKLYPGGKASINRIFDNGLGADSMFTAHDLPIRVVRPGRRLFVVPITHDSVPARLAAECSQVLWGGTWYGTAVKIASPKSLNPSTEFYEQGIAIEGVNDEAFAINNMGMYGTEWKKMAKDHFNGSYSAIAEAAKTELLSPGTFSRSSPAVRAAKIVTTVASCCREKIDSTCRLLGQPAGKHLVITGGPAANVALQLALNRQGFVLRSSPVAGKDTHYGAAARAMVIAGICNNFSKALSILASLDRS